MKHTPSRCERTEHLFIVRIWYEPDAVTSVAQWRASVQNGAERRYFASWQEMMGYLAAHAASSGGHGAPR